MNPQYVNHKFTFSKKYTLSIDLIVYTTKSNICKEKTIFPQSLKIGLCKKKINESILCFIVKVFADFVTLIFALFNDFVVSINIYNNQYNFLG